jgi:hypothetical protein
MIHVTREALIAAKQWPALVQHALTHGDVRPGWLASAGDLDALALTDAGAQLSALEGLDPAPLLALGADPTRVRAIAEAFNALEPTSKDLSSVRVRALTAWRPRATVKTGGLND